MLLLFLFSKQRGILLAVISIISKAIVIWNSFEHRLFNWHDTRQPLGTGQNYFLTLSYEWIHPGFDQLFLRVNSVKFSFLFPNSLNNFFEFMVLYFFSIRYCFTRDILYHIMCQWHNISFRLFFCILKFS